MKTYKRGTRLEKRAKNKQRTRTAKESLGRAKMSRPDLELGYDSSFLRPANKKQTNPFSNKTSAAQWPQLAMMPVLSDQPLAT